MGIYTSTFKEQLASAFNAVNNLPFPLNANDFNMGTPGAATPPAAGFKFNTTNKLIPTQAPSLTGESYGGSVDIKYLRLDLGLLFKGIDLRWESGVNSTSSFPAWVREYLAVPMEDSDVLVEAIPASANNSYVTVKANPTSPWFIGQCRVYFTKGLADIGDLIPNDWDTGLYPTLATVDSTYMATYYEDYTGNGQTLRASMSPAAGFAATEKTWQLTMGSLPNEWRVGRVSGIEYKTPAAVIAAGGRPGFTNLIVYAALNIWAHFNE